MTRFLSAAAVAVAAAVLTAASAAAGGPWQPLAPTGAQRATIHILPAVHGQEVVSDPNIAIVPDLPVTLTIVNTSRADHTFTIPRLHVNVLVRAGSRAHPSMTSVTFTAPSTGTFTWYCEFCPAVHHKGGMHGRVYALVSG